MSSADVITLDSDGDDEAPAAAAAAAAAAAPELVTGEQVAAAAAQFSDSIGGRTRETCAKLRIPYSTDEQGE